jgi:hypothetical protein
MQNNSNRKHMSRLSFNQNQITFQRPFLAKDTWSSFVLRHMPVLRFLTYMPPLLTWGTYRCPFSDNRSLFGANSHWTAYVARTMVFGRAVLW